MLSSDDKCVHLSSVMGSPTYTVTSSAFLSFVCLNACQDGLGHLFRDELPSLRGGLRYLRFIVLSKTPSFWLISDICYHRLLPTSSSTAPSTRVCCTPYCEEFHWASKGGIMAMPNRTDGVLISRLYIFYIFSSKMSKGHSLKGLSLLTGLPT